MVGFRDQDHTIRESYMEVLLGCVQEAICGSHLPEQHEERVPQFKTKTYECHRVLGRIHLVEQVCS